MSHVNLFEMPSLMPVKNQLISNSVGSIVEINEQGIARVDFPENMGNPIVARSTLGEIDKTQLSSLPVCVLLVFEQSNPLKPIITGFVNDALFTAHPIIKKNAANESSKSPNIAFSSKMTNAHIDGKKITFDAKEEIFLGCGKSSILLRNDGKVVIKGANLVSRASSSNKIKGSSVGIN